MELAKRANLYSKQVAKGGSLLGQKQETAKKGKKRAGGERVLGVLVPPRDQFHILKTVLYPLL